MPAGDPAGYLPSVKRARAKRGQPVYQPKAVSPYKTRKRCRSRQVAPDSNEGAMPSGLSNMAPAKPKPTPKGVSATTVGASKGGPTVFGPTEVNRTKNSRAGLTFRNMVKNGVKYHVYRIRGKRKVVKANSNPSRKLH